MVRWNFDKSYLIALAEAGVRVPKTILVDAQDPASIHAALESGG